MIYLIYMRSPASPSATTAFHAGGRETFRHESEMGEGRMWSACRILRHRLESRCQPVSLLGRIRVFLARRRWTLRLRRRFDRPYALFLGAPAIFRIRNCSRDHCR